MASQSAAIPPQRGRSWTLSRRRRGGSWGGSRNWGRGNTLAADPGKTPYPKSPVLASGDQGPRLTDASIVCVASGFSRKFKCRRPLFRLKAEATREDSQVLQACTTQSCNALYPEQYLRKQSEILTLS